MSVNNRPSEELQLPESPVGKKKNEEVISVKDDSGSGFHSEDILDPKNYIDNNNEIAKNTQINITNSQHVVIGNVTHVHEAPINQSAIGNEISINSEEEAAKIEDGQHLDKSKLVISKNTIVTNSIESTTAHLQEDAEEIKNQTTAKKCYKRLRYILLIIIILLLVTCLTISFVILFVIPNIKTTTEAENGSHLGTHKLLYRKDWNGRPTEKYCFMNKTLHHPTKTVIISHSATSFCTSEEKCSRSVRDMQDHHVSKNCSPGVGYNFLIGGDANIYVGRGWDIVNFQQDNSIIISFIGNFTYDELSEGMIEAAKFLIEQGVKENKLSIDYKIISHNSIMQTESPGANVYKVIKTWDHFSEKSYVNSKRKLLYLLIFLIAGVLYYNISYL